jgi:RNA polymerase sigma factor (sigma-70 family)
MAAVRELQALFEAGSLAGLTDGQLLDRFVFRREPAAFEALIRRHGPMVWGVCRRVLLDGHDAEDAFQATFLVLARKAASVDPREKVGNWLYGVAYHTAKKARAMRTRRRSRELPLSDLCDPEVGPDEHRDDLLRALDRELSRLPEKYRTVVVLCELEGMTHKEAAERLNCPIGTVSARLSRARAMLARRLSRPGRVLSGGTVVALLYRDVRSAEMPSRLVARTTRAATKFVGGHVVSAGVVSAEAVALSGEVLKAMLLNKLKVATTLLALSVLFAGGAGLVYRAHGSEPPRQERKLKAPRSPSPAEQFLALVREFDAAMKEIEPLKTKPDRTWCDQKVVLHESFGRQALEIARANPNDPAALDALIWSCCQLRHRATIGAALEQLRRDHVTSDRLSMVCDGTLASLYTTPGSVYRFLRDVLERNPSREVRGRACYALARLLEVHASGIRSIAIDPEMRKIIEDLLKTPENLSAWRARTPEDLDEEAELVYERAGREFADVKLADGRTLGQVTPGDLTRLRQLIPGEPAPEIEGRDSEGKPFKLSDYRGKVVVLCFSGNWCGPCRAMYPQERKLADRLKNQPFAMLGVNTDNDLTTLRKSVSEGEITWRCWWDGGQTGPIVTRWGVQGFPSVYVLDKAGVIRFVHVQGDELDKAVDSLLK